MDLEPQRNGGFGVGTVLDECEDCSSLKHSANEKFRGQGNVIGSIKQTKKQWNTPLFCIKFHFWLCSKLVPDFARSEHELLCFWCWESQTLLLWRPLFLIPAGKVLLIPLYTLLSVFSTVSTVLTTFVFLHIWWKQNDILPVSSCCGRVHRLAHLMLCLSRRLL